MCGSLNIRHKGACVHDHYLETTRWSCKYFDAQPNFLSIFTFRKALEGHSPRLFATRPFNHYVLYVVAMVSIGSFQFILGMSSYSSG